MDVLDAPVEVRRATTGRRSERLRSSWTREMWMTSSTIERDVYRLALYTPPQAARIVAVPSGDPS